MNKEEIVAYASEAAKGIKTEEDVTERIKIFRKAFYEKALSLELDELLGYSKHGVTDSKNSRNGYSRKTMMNEGSSFEPDAPEH